MHRRLRYSRVGILLRRSEERHQHLSPGIIPSHTNNQWYGVDFYKPLIAYVQSPVASDQSRIFKLTRHDYDLSIYQLFLKRNGL